MNNYEMRAAEQRMGAALDKAGHLLEDGAAGLSGLSGPEADDRFNALRESLADEGLRRKSLRLLIFIDNAIGALEGAALKEGDDKLGMAARMTRKILALLCGAMFGKGALNSENPEELQKYFAENNLRFDPDSPEGRQFVENIRLKLRESANGKA